MRRRFTSAVTSAQPAHGDRVDQLINDPSNPAQAGDWDKDLRDPIIWDPTVTIAQFVRASDPTTTIGALVSGPTIRGRTYERPGDDHRALPRWLRGIRRACGGRASTRPRTSQASVG
jgi:hypothetical protein